MRKYILMLLFVYCMAKKQIWNDQTDMLLEYFGIGYRESNLTDIPIMDLVNDKMSIRGIRLGDISTIKRLSDVILENTNNGNRRVSGTFGLGNFKMTISNIRISNHNLGQSIITSKKNSAEIAYTIKDDNNLRICRTKWKKFQLGEFSDVHLKNSTVSKNITHHFNKRILPDLNHYFKSPQFLSFLSKTFEFCDIKRFLSPFHF